VDGARELLCIFIFIDQDSLVAALEQVTRPLPGGHLVENYLKALTVGPQNVGATVGTMMVNSYIMAIGITFGKIAISLLAAFAIVYFRFRLRMFFSG
jgi:sn-glycerol 3-phosphate transport system permease protein